MGGDASLCFDGFTRVCLQALPTTPLVVGSTMTIDTTTGCAETTMGTASGVCVVAATVIEVSAGATLRVTGPKPLALLATRSIFVAGTLDDARLEQAVTQRHQQVRHHDLEGRLICHAMHGAQRRRAVADEVLDVDAP
jgi:hypothetical protein